MHAVTSRELGLYGLYSYLKPQGRIFIEKETTLFTRIREIKSGLQSKGRT